jgi:hypothetical protein
MYIHRLFSDVLFDVNRGNLKDCEIIHVIEKYRFLELSVHVRISAKIRFFAAKSWQSCQRTGKALKDELFPRYVMIIGYCIPEEGGRAGDQTGGGLHSIHQSINRQH